MRNSLYGVVKSYHQAAEYLSKGRNPLRRKLPGKETTLVKYNDGRIAVQYWATSIVTYYEDGTIVLNTEGYRTFTTKGKMNEYLPNAYGVSQNKNIWYVSNGQKAELYEDGLTFRPDGTMTGFAPEGAEKKQTKLNKAIAKYANDYVTELMAGHIPQPSAGDCWFCSMKDAKTGKPLGDTTHDDEHLRSHIEEKYYVPSLIFNVLAESGSMWDKQAVQSAIFNQDFDMLIGGVENRLKKMIRRYIRARLDLASSQ